MWQKVNRGCSAGWKGWCVVMHYLHSRRRGRCSSAGFYAAQAVHAGAGQGGLETRTSCVSAQRGRRLFPCVGRSTCGLASTPGRRGAGTEQSLSRFTPFHKTRPLPAVRKESQNVKGHRNGCLEAMSVLACITASHGVTEMWQ